MPTIHPSAVVDPTCELADDVAIGPWCVVRGRVSLARGVRLISNVVLDGVVSIGEGTLVYPFACVGYPGQDFKFKQGMATAGVVVGRECVLREHATIHASTGDHTPTRVGDSVYMMVNAHVAHDCTVEDRVVMVNNSAIGGHVKVGAGATLGGGSVVHQHCRIGRLAMISGFSAATADVPPFCMSVDRARLVGINLVGLRRSGMPREHITRVRTAFRRALGVAGTRPQILATLDELAVGCPPVAEIAEFVRSAKKPIATGRHARRGELHSAEASEMMPGD